MNGRTYIAIDLKSFYASVECVERGLDPLDAHLVVADESRTDKTICLAVSPALKALGIAGRPRLFEVMEQVEKINVQRRLQAPGRRFQGTTHLASRLRENSALALSYIVAPPRMAFYIEYSTRIYQVYLKYVAPEDIHVYSIDEVFIDATDYLATSGLSPRQMAMNMILDVLRHTGVTATAGIGPNLYLCKIAMDIRAKHLPADENGVRIAELDEETYRRTLWSHRPLTDFWRVGRGSAARLEGRGLFTMGDIARQSLRDEELLYRLFGVNAELLIDHAWGQESCTMADIKSYRPEAESLSSGQVLPCAYEADKARLVLREMADALALSLVDKGMTAGQVAVMAGYDAGEEGVSGPAHGSQRLPRQTASARLVTEAALAIFDRTVDPRRKIRRLSIAVADLATEDAAAGPRECTEQLDMFTDYEALDRQRAAEDEAIAREKQRQLAVLDIRKKFGRNAILMGTSLMEGATGRERNRQIGGHRA